eukprot:Clim_evm44s225 gene=Clim_evmTU44s225
MHVSIIFLSALLPLVAGHGTVHSFLHLGDAHLDKHYKPASRISRDCHRGQGVAGQFGSRTCDAPWKLIDTLLDVVADELETPQFIMWTGDSSRHDTDESKPRKHHEVVQEIRKVAKKIHSAFPSVPVIPSIGNYDLWPLNQLGEGPNEMLLELADIFSPFLSKEELTKFIRGGYYARELPDKVTAVALNTVYFVAFNESTKGCNHKKSAGHLQMQWLRDVLKDAKEKGRGVYISGHLGPHHLWYPNCHREYIDIIAEYKDTVMVQVFSHLHKDEYFLLEKNHEIVGVLNYAPSMAPVYNPGVRVYLYNHLTSLPWITNYEQYYVDLADANKNGEIQLRQEYSWIEAYQATQWTLEQWAEVDKKISENEYYRNRYLDFKHVLTETDHSSHHHHPHHHVIAAIKEHAEIDESPGEEKRIVV